MASANSGVHVLGSFEWVPVQRLEGRFCVSKTATSLVAKFVVFLNFLLCKCHLNPVVTIEDSSSTPGRVGLVFRIHTGPSYFQHDNH